jgi:hypothetical protein
MNSVGGISPLNTVLNSRPVIRRAVRFGAESYKPADPTPSLPPTSSPSSTKASLGEKIRNLAPFKRLKNGVNDVVDLFTRDFWQTMKRAVIYTVVLTLYTFILGPLLPIAIPLYAVSGLGFEAAYAFISGVRRNPHEPKINVEKNPTSDSSTEAKSAPPKAG